ncbi:alpha/beta-hydrolase [Thelephora ganbajun]|uniref:Alpha/beta-hydrolase n=1 Tax=Thelephora ganbajun TaxID=370292 RepID=A0ACB6ZAI7_THEGA|nr:alpha/beta-hydrolase [Thelephora ganbajun]
MVITSGFLALSSLFILAAPVSAVPSSFGRLQRASEGNDILWENCSTFGVDSRDPRLTCGYHEVPMDYHDPRAGKARLAVARYAATAPQKLGTLFVNPGGPGNSGVDLIAQNGQNISLLFRGTYDIVSWDPRGVGLYTFPGAVTCFNSQAEEGAFFQNTIVQSINHTIAGKFDQQDLDEFFSRTEEDSRLLLEFGARCQRGPVGKFLQYIGTSSTVRDLASLGNLIVGKDKPIDYWGVSYGTVIGINFLNMFPERAGHVILDGVVDPNTWVSHKILRTALIDGEKTYSALTDACAASGKAGCRLVELVGDHATGPDIKRLLNDAHDTALRLLRAGFDKFPIKPGEMRAELHDVLTTPVFWSPFINGEVFHTVVLIFQTAQSLNISYGGNGTYHIPSGTVNISTSLFKSGTSSSPAQNLTDHAFEAIIGADNFIDIENHIVMKDVLNEIVDITRAVSPAFGAVWRLGHNFGWPVRSVERLPPFDFSKLKNPVLVIGNTADPITPFVSAQAAANLLGKHATLVEQLGVGHVSIAQFSLCTLSTIANYVLASKLPEVPNGGHIKCEVDPSNILFPPIGTSTPAKRGFNQFMRRRW